MLLAVQGAAHRPQSFLGSFFAGHCHYLPGRSRCVLVDSGESCGVEEGGCEAPARPPPVSSLALLAGRADKDRRRICKERFTDLHGNANPRQSSARPPNFLSKGLGKNSLTLSSPNANTQGGYCS